MQYYIVAWVSADRWWAWLADLVLAIHMAFVGFIVGGLLLIAMGGLCGWRWARHRRFRQIHAGAMGVVLVETLLGIICPLTEWEAALRIRAGQEPYGDAAFMQYWLQQWLYWDWSPRVFIALYSGVFAAIVAGWFVVPPHPAGRAK